MRRCILFILVILSYPAYAGDFSIPAGFPQLYNRVFSLEIAEARPGMGALKGPFRVYLENLDPRCPYNRFLRSEILIQWAILKLKFGQRNKTDI